MIKSCIQKTMYIYKKNELNLYIRIYEFNLFRDLIHTSMHINSHKFTHTL